MTDRRSWLMLVLAARPGVAGGRAAGGRRADAVRVRQREPVRHDGPARRLRRRARGGAAEPLRRPLPLARQPARSSSRGWPRATRSRPTGSPTPSSCGAAPSSTTAPRSRPRTCATASSASWPSRRARPRSWPRWSRRAATKAVDKSTVQFTLDQARVDLPGGGARGPRGQLRPPQEEREGRRLGRGLADQQRRGLRLLHAHALRPRRRLHRQALPGPLHAVGARSTSTRSSSGWSRKTTRACSA